jgi:hypothetical protein
MKAKRIQFSSLRDAVDAIESIGAGNGLMMAGKALHVNILLYSVPGPQAKKLKAAYNDIGAEAAISSDAYFEKEGAITDMIIMGTIYQHREVRRILSGLEELADHLTRIAEIVDLSHEAVE